MPAARARCSRVSGALRAPDVLGSERRACARAWYNVALRHALHDLVERHDVEQRVEHTEQGAEDGERGDANLEVAVVEGVHLPHTRCRGLSGARSTECAGM